jgi:hypothetical protein
MKKISLYNEYHNGDIFYSRVLIQNLSKFFEIDYYHKNNLGQFEDLSNINEFPILKLNESDLETPRFNTWVGQQNAKFLKDTLCSFYTNKKILNDFFKNEEFKILNDLELLPVILYENLPKIEIVKTKLSQYNQYNKKILICNNKVLSGQSSNFDFDLLLQNIVTKYKNFLFVFTNPTNLEGQNILYIKNLTEVDFDLLYISYISTKCNLIIGRASGPYCYTHVKENLMDVDKKFISICNNELEGVWYKESLAKQIWTNCFEFDNISNIIIKELESW